MFLTHGNDEALTTSEGTHHSEDHPKRFKCNSCPYSTSLKFNMKKHLLVHSGERPYKCDVCTHSFTQHHALKRHMLIHTGEMPYSCNLCSMCFRHAHRLKQHMLKHA